MFRTSLLSLYGRLTGAALGHFELELWTTKTEFEILLRTQLGKAHFVIVEVAD